MLVKRIGLGAWAAWSLALVAACASSSPREAAASKWGTSGESVTQGEEEATSLTPSSALPSSVIAVEYVVWDSSSDATLRAEWTPKPGGAAGWQVSWQSGAGKPLKEDEYRIDNGALVLLRNVDYGEQVEAVFDPPLLVLPPMLNMGQTATQQTRMTVHPLSDPSKTRAAGPVTNQVTYERDERIRTPAGTWTARHVQTVFAAELSGTKVRDQTDQWYVDGVGMVAERRSERTTLIGVPVRSIDEAWVAQRIGASDSRSPQ